MRKPTNARTVPSLRTMLFAALGICIPWCTAWSACTGAFSSETVEATLVCDSADDAIVVTQEFGFWKHSPRPSDEGFDNDLDWDSSAAHGDLSVVSGTLQIQLMNGPKLTLGDGSVGAVDMVGSIRLFGTDGKLTIDSSNSPRASNYFLNDGLPDEIMIVSNFTIHNGIGELPVSVLTGSGDDQITVASTYVDNPLTILGGTSGLDSVSIGSGRVERIEGGLSITNVHVVVVDDRDETDDRVATLLDQDSITEIQGLTNRPIELERVNNMSLVFGSGNDFVTVSDTHGTTQLFLGDGNNECFIRGAGLESGSTNLFSGGSDRDAFTISAATSAVSAIVVDGGLPDTVPGDTLVYIGGAATTDGDDLTPDDLGAAPIHYVSIEDLQLNLDRIFRGEFEQGPSTPTK